MLKEFLARPEVTEVCELRGRFGVMAYHGGNLERTTDVVAREVATRTGASLYTVVQEAPHRVHLASTAFDPAQSSRLASFLGHVDVVIAVHGYGRRALWHHLLLGGRNRHLANHLAQHLRAGLPEPYRVLDDLAAMPKELRGQHRRNPVNLPRAHGAQLELPPSIRWNRSENGWSDHQGVSRAPDVDRLIDALCQAVVAWPASTAQTAASGP
ncbi:MAG: poly-gamma-glutamate hydrolase family protein [Myxococcota bacterium]|nr:poly-gamma-glutamate hydrolase family protein [Myxococcota bacterium]